MIDDGARDVPRVPLFQLGLLLFFFKKKLFKLFKKKRKRKSEEAQIECLVHCALNQWMPHILIN